MNPPREEPWIVFFDGVCQVCDRAVDFIIQSGDPQLIKITPLQGDTAAEHLQGQELPDSIVLYNGKDYLVESDAVIAIGQRLGGIWKILANGLRIWPRWIRDGGYRIVARYRYKLLPPKPSCRLPTERDRSFFLP